MIHNHLSLWTFLQPQEDNKSLVGGSNDVLSKKESDYFLSCQIVTSFVNSREFDILLVALCLLNLIPLTHIFWAPS